MHAVICLMFDFPAFSCISLIIIKTNEKVQRKLKTLIPLLGIQDISHVCMRIIKKRLCCATPSLHSVYEYYGWFFMLRFRIHSINHAEHASCLRQRGKLLCKINCNPYKCCLDETVPRHIPIATTVQPFKAESVLSGARLLGSLSYSLQNR